jgi:hypothetical protein
MRNVVIFIFSIFTPLAFAVDIASCSNPSGKAYYPEYGLISKEKAGWEQDEKITGGITKLSKIGKDKYDILFVDSTKRIVSSVEDGGTVLSLNKSPDAASFLVIYPGKTVEIYTFLKTISGKFEYMHVTSRSGDSVFITKASVMRGDCEYIDFNKL